MRAMDFRLALLPTVLLFGLFSTTYAANFTFDFGTPTQCDNFPVSWTGGSPPFSLVLAPEFGTPRTFNIPESSFTNGQGAFQAQVPFPENQTFLAIMSDATGWGSGGVSKVLTVGPQVGTNNCNTTDPGVDFFFQLNTALQQCRPYTFDGYTGAVQPVTIRGLVPGGETFVLTAPKGPTSFTWDAADAAAGTSLMFIMTDAQGRQGGSSDVKVVGVSDDKTCLNADSPTSLAVIPSATASSSTSSSGAAGSPTPGSGKPTNGSANEAGGSSSKSNTGVIIGGVLAALFGIAAIIALVLFFLRRRKNRSAQFYDNDGYGYRPRRGGRMNSMDLDAPAVLEDGQPAPVVNPYPYTPSSIAQSQHAGGAVSHAGSASVHELLPRGSQYTASQYPGSQYPGSQYDAQTQYSAHLSNPYSAPSESSYSQHQRGPSGSDVGGAMSAVGGAMSMRSGDTSSMTSSARRKAAMAGIPSVPKPPTRYIVHTDLEEELPEEEPEVVELPPQYSERRAPIPVLSSYAAPPPGAPAPDAHANPLEVEEAGSSSRLQEPIQPATPTTAGPLPYKS